MPQTFLRCLIAFALLPASLHAQEQTDTAEKHLERTQEVLDIILSYRGLGVSEPVKTGVMSKDELSEVHQEKAFEDQSPEELRDQERILVKLDIIAPDFLFFDFFLELLTEQVAGFYDPEAKELYLIADDDPEALDVVLSHELFHAIQDQNFDLLTYIPDSSKPDIPDVTDLITARMAVVEGDASAVMIDFGSKGKTSFSDIPGFPQLIRMASSTTSGAEAELLNRAPLVVRESLIFPYVEGLVFVYEIKRHGGWDAVNKVYTDPPLSTEQILHPERYIQRDDPTWITLDVVDLPNPFDTYRVISSDIGGELGLYLFLEQHLEGNPITRTAADGWDGDRALSLESPDGELLLINHTLFDSIGDATEAHDAYKDLMLARFPEATHQPLAIPGGSGFIVMRAQELILVEQRGAELLHIEGIPAHGEDANASLLQLRNHIWDRRKFTAYPKL